MSPPSPASPPTRPAAARLSSSAVVGRVHGRTMGTSRRTGSTSSDSSPPVRRRGAPPFSQVRLARPPLTRFCCGHRQRRRSVSTHRPSHPPCGDRERCRGRRRARRHGWWCLSRCRVWQRHGSSPRGLPSPTGGVSSDAGDVAADADARVRTAVRALHGVEPVTPEGPATPQLGTPQRWPRLGRVACFRWRSVRGARLGRDVHRGQWRRRGRQALGSRRPRTDTGLGRAGRGRGRGRVQDDGGDA